MGFASLGSGSSGNATIVAVSRSIFLVDCGFKVRTMERRLSQLDISPGDIDAVFITHEHSDHISGLAGFLNSAKPEISDLSKLLIKMGRVGFEPTKILIV